MSYKCTDFCDDEVLFSGIAHGGRTELSPDKAPSALMSVTVAEELGIFGVKPSKAMDMLTGKRVSLGLSIEAYDREVRKNVHAGNCCSERGMVLFVGLLCFASACLGGMFCSVINAVCVLFLLSLGDELLFFFLRSWVCGRGHTHGWKRKRKRKRLKV